MRSYLAIVILLLGTACIKIGSEPQPISYYLLEPTAVLAPQSTVSASGQRLALGPINFPRYLDRPELVTRKQDNSIIVAEQDRWAEPLSDNLTRTLAENLSRQLPGLQIDRVPWDTNGKDRLAAEITINRFDGIPGERTDVDIRWQLTAPPNSRLVKTGHFIHQGKISDNYSGLVRGLNAALLKFSQTLADAVSAQQPD